MRVCIFLFYCLVFVNCRAAGSDLSWLVSWVQSSRLERSACTVITATDVHGGLIQPERLKGQSLHFTAYYLHRAGSPWHYTSGGNSFKLNLHEHTHSHITHTFVLYSAVYLNEIFFKPMHRTGLSDHFSYTANCTTNVRTSQWGKIKGKRQCLKDLYEQRWAINY